MTITKVSTGLIEADAASVNLNIDENTLYIDVTTNRVGIGNTNPSTALDVTGSVTASGLVIGNINIDGTTIALSSGDLTLDVAGDIILDAGGDDITFKTNGVEFGSIFYLNSNLYLNSAVSDGDMLFRGNDGGSAINALTLDMSEAGAATFNSTITTGGNITIGNTSLSQTILQFLSATNGANTIHFGDGASADAYKGYINYNHTADRLELVGSGDMLIDVAGEIQLDSDSGIIRVRDAGGDYGMFQISSSDFIVRSMVQDKDLLFKGNDGGSIITALTLDMSAAGAATFNSGVVVNESGADSDFRVESNGNENMFFVDAGNGRVNVAGDGPAVSALNVRNSLAISNSGGAQHILMGNQDSGGVNKPFMLTSANAALYVGVGDSWASSTGGTRTDIAYFDTTQIVFNEDSNDQDFRVESSNKTHMLYVDASEDEVVVGEGGVNQANATLALNTGSNKHGKSIHSNNTITGSAEASVMAEGTFAVNTTSLGTKLTIPIFSQGSSWKKYIIEFMFSSAEYNLSGNANAGTCTLAFTSLSVADNMILLSSTGNVTSANVSGSNIEINFTNGFASGTSNYEGVLVYYKILSSVPSYVQTWNATLN